MWRSPDATCVSMEADYDVVTVLPLLFPALILLFNEEFTSSQVLPSGIYEDRMYIYNVCGWWVEYCALEDWIYNLVPELRGKWERRIRERSCVVWGAYLLFLSVFSLLGSVPLFTSAVWAIFQSAVNTEDMGQAGVPAEKEGSVVCHCEFGDSRIVCVLITPLRFCLIFQHVLSLSHSFYLR